MRNMHKINLKIVDIFMVSYIIRHAIKQMEQDNEYT